MDKKRKAINDRFIKVINELITKNKCKNKREFSDLIGVDPSRITQISNYSQNLSYEMMLKMNEKFDISMDYILFNVGSPFISAPKKDTLEDVLQRLSELENIVNRTKQ